MRTIKTCDFNIELFEQKFSPEIARQIAQEMMMYG